MTLQLQFWRTHFLQVAQETSQVEISSPEFQALQTKGVEAIEAVLAKTASLKKDEATLVMEEIGKSKFSLADRSRLVFQITAKAMERGKIPDLQSLKVWKFESLKNWIYIYIREAWKFERLTVWQTSESLNVWKLQSLKVWKLEMLKTINIWKFESLKSWKYERLKQLNRSSPT